MLIALSFNAQAEGTNMKQLFLDAMTSPTKTASAEINGPLAEMIRNRTHMTGARIMADVSVIKDLPQDGCKRLKMVLTMPGSKIPRKDGTSEPFHLENLFNMCENGQPPDMGDDTSATDASMKNLKEYERRSKAYSENQGQQ